MLINYKKPNIYTATIHRNGEDFTFRVFPGVNDIPDSTIEAFAAPPAHSQFAALFERGDAEVASKEPFQDLKPPAQIAIVKETFNRDLLRAFKHQAKAPEVIDAIEAQIETVTPRSKAS